MLSSASHKVIDARPGRDFLVDLERIGRCHHPTIANPVSRCRRDDKWSKKAVRRLIFDVFWAGPRWPARRRNHRLSAFWVVQQMKVPPKLGDVYDQPEQ